MPVSTLALLKKLLVVAVFGLLASALSAQGPYYRIVTPTAADLHDFFVWQPHQYPLVSAHRGGNFQGYPENCLETFDYLLRHTHAVIETDIAMSKDSVLVMMHDDNLDRTTNGLGPVASKTFEELTALRLRDNAGQLTEFGIPTLSAVLDWARDKTTLMLDIKRSTPLMRVLESVKAAHAEAYVVIIVYRVEDAVRVHAFDPNLLISLTIYKPEDLVRATESGLPDSALVAFTGISLSDSTTYRQLQNHGIVSILGTMGNLDRKAEARGDEAVYTELLHAGPDMLSTDRPLVLGEVIRQNFQMLEEEKRYFIFPEE